MQINTKTVFHERCIDATVAKFTWRRLPWKHPKTLQSSVVITSISSLSIKQCIKYDNTILFGYGNCIKIVIVIKIYDT